LFVGHDFVVDINHRENDADVVFCKESIEGRLPQAVAFACETPHAIAVDSVVELALRGDNEDLAGGKVRGER
jgi:hypothetical protein